MENFGAAKVKLQELGLKINQEESELVFKAPMAVEIDDDAFASLEAAMERLLDLDDVDAVYTNAEGLA